MKDLRRCVAMAAVVALGLLAGRMTAQAQTARQLATATVLSTRPDFVSGGDALIRIEAPAAVKANVVKVSLNGRDVTSSFRAEAAGHALIGLVKGLRVGVNSINTSGPGMDSSALTVTNYPITGPIISGPHITPFICQTEDFLLPNGSKLGPSTDEDCSAPAAIQYLYMPKGGNAFKPMPGISELPPDVAMTTTTTGANAPFVVRVETSTINRGIYQSAILHDPTTEPEPSPTAPPKAWNQRLVAIHGFGCPGGWYIQGPAQGNAASGAGGRRAELLDSERLGQGFATFTNTLQHPSNNCNAVLQIETAMMSKEHFVETYGLPRYTVSHGCSGGAYTSLQVGDALPGIFDGILIGCTFPDPLAVATEGQHSRLVAHYFQVTNRDGFTDDEKIAATGYKGLQAFIDAANQAQRMDPIPGRQDIAGYNPAGWNDGGVPESLRYHPETNPHGARPTVYDWARNVLGVDPDTGFALRPFDNVGVQYGLKALLAGKISKDQFLDLNEKVGGFDDNANYVPTRSQGDEGAIRRAYAGGLHFTGSGGIGSIPVMDYSGIFNDDSRYHYQWFHFAARQRIAEANGNADNHVMWRGDPVPYLQAWDKLTEWIDAYKADASTDSQRSKVIRHKSTVDGCFDADGTFISEPQTRSSEPDSRCNTLFPSYTSTQLVAGMPLSVNILKCQLKPVDPADYAPAVFTGSEIARLKAIFRDGVCDWSKPGVSQTPVTPYPSFGPAPVNRVSDATKR